MMLSQREREKGIRQRGVTNVKEGPSKSLQKTRGKKGTPSTLVNTVRQEGWTGGENGSKKRS